MPKSNKETLADYLVKETPKTRKSFAGSNSVGGDKNIDGHRELLITQDGTKKRRGVKKTTSSGGDSVAEIITLDDGRKVRRIKKKKKSSQDDKSKDAEKSKKSSRKSLGSFLETTESTGTRNLGGSSSVAGDKIAIGKESSLTGENYMRDDGQRKTNLQTKARLEAASDDNIISVEYVTRDDGTKVKRIKKRKIVKKPKKEKKDTKEKKEKKDSDEVSTKSDKKKKNKSKMKQPKDEDKPKESKKNVALGTFFSTEDNNAPKHTGESKTVAGDQLNVEKNQSLTGNNFVRSDGIRKVTKPKSKVEPGDRVEIITLPDGRKVRRIYKTKKKPATVSAAEKDDTADPDPRSNVSRGGSKTLEDFMGNSASNALKKLGGSSSVGGDVVQENEKPAPAVKKALPTALVRQIISRPYIRDIIHVPPKQNLPHRLLEESLRKEIVHHAPLKPTKTAVSRRSTRAQLAAPTFSSNQVSKTLANMSWMGPTFDAGKMNEMLKKLEEAEKMEELLKKLEEAETRRKAAEESLKKLEEAETRRKEAEQRELKLQAELEEAKSTLSKIGGDDLGQKVLELEKEKKKLVKQLLDNKIDPAENIPYEECVTKIREIGLRLEEIGDADIQHEDKEVEFKLRKEYYILSVEMVRYNKALVNSDEFQAEEKRKDKEWNETQGPLNLEALKKLRRHMPVEIRNLSELELKSQVSPAGKKLPAAMARRFKRTNVLQLIRRDPQDIMNMHPGGLENFRVAGLTLTERRALYEHMRPNAGPWEAGESNKLTKRKWEWFKTMKENFVEELDKYDWHMQEFGPPENHKCNMIGRSCPMRADKTVDYDNDYGWTDDDVYEKSDVKKSSVDNVGGAQAEALKLLNEKRANERNEALKIHYKAKKLPGNLLLQVSKAKGACENMDSMMDKMEFAVEQWTKKVLEIGDDESKLTDDIKKKEIALYRNNLKDNKILIQDMCGRSGMSVKGVDKGDEKPDPRSAIECSLAEEVQETFVVYTKWIADRLQKIEMENPEIKNNSTMLNDLLSKLHDKNISTMKDLGVDREKRSRPLKTAAKIEAEVTKQQGEGPSKDSVSSPKVTENRPKPGGLMDAINTKRKQGGTPGGLMDAIAGKGKQGGGIRGGLMSAIANAAK